MMDAQKRARGLYDGILEIIVDLSPEETDAKNVGDMAEKDLEKKLAGQ